jgi:hypothetical protein
VITLRGFLPETTHHRYPVVGRIGHPEDKTVRYARGPTTRTVTIEFDVETDDDVRELHELACKYARR